ncbi:hypothetical protein Tco_0825420 [Tanacetum coccineum]
MPRECLRIIESKSKVRNSRNKAVVAKVSSNSSTPGISPDVAALTTEVSELKNLMKQCFIVQTKIFKPPTVKAVEQDVTSLPTSDESATSLSSSSSANARHTKPIFENYVSKVNNDAVLRNMQNQGQGLQNQMTNLTEMLSKFITSNTASSSNSGTLPSQTVTNPREHVNAITTRSGKTCEGPSTPLVPTPVVSTPLKEPEQNPETSTDKVQKPSLESTTQVPPPEEEDSIFMEKPKAKKTVNIEIQEPNSPKPTSVST